MLSQTFSIQQDTMSRLSISAATSYTLNSVHETVRRPKMYDVSPNRSVHTHAKSNGTDYYSEWCCYNYREVKPCRISSLTHAWVDLINMSTRRIEADQEHLVVLKCCCPDRI